jgi:hypothetical protein
MVDQPLIIADCEQMIQILETDPSLLLAPSRACSPLPEARSVRSQQFAAASQASEAFRFAL